jgi:hypothetical protein
MEDVLSAVQETTYSSLGALLPSWIKGGVNATLFLQNMSKPQHGTIQLLKDNVWSFYPGKSTGAESIVLPDLSAHCQQLLDMGKLFKGHAKFKYVYGARNQLSLHDCVLHYVSAHGLKSLVAPLSLKHHKNMYSGDKFIWDTAYTNPGWEVITEEEF